MKKKHEKKNQKESKDKNDYCENCLQNVYVSNV